MKTQQPSTVNKLIERFDNELKSILMGDLKMAKTRTLVNNLKKGLNNQLSAA